jgi:hypothetical protein
LQKQKSGRKDKLQPPVLRMGAVWAFEKVEPVAYGYSD